MARLLTVIVIAMAASRCSAIFPFNLEAVDVVVTNVKDHLDDTIDPYLVPIEHNTYGQSPYGYVPQKYVNEPICPLYIKPVWEEAVVQQVVHSLVTVWEKLQKTEFVHVTETLKYPVTVINRSTVTIPAPPIYKTETIIVPEEKTVMSARIDTVTYTITQTNLEVITYTLTNTITTTTFEAEWITLTEYETSWETVNVPVTSITTVWTQEVEVVTQPVYVTTNLWVEAPQLSLITSTHYVPHYHTQTTTVTNKVYETICTKPGYY